MKHETSWSSKALCHVHLVSTKVLDREIYGSCTQFGFFGRLFARLLGIVRRNWWCIINLDATPLLVFAVMEGQFPTTLVLGCAQPQPHQVPTRRWRWEVFVCCSGVEDVVVRQELDVTDIQDHVKGKAQAGLVEDSSSTDLLWRKRRDEALFTEACEGLDIVWIPPDLR